MEYRKLPKGGECVSILGLGTSSFGMAGEKDIESAMTMALEAGINFFDMASAGAAPFPSHEKSIAGMREKKPETVPGAATATIAARSM